MDEERRLQVPGGVTSTTLWTGPLEFEMHSDSWFWPRMIVTLDVREAVVDIWRGDRLIGSVARERLREWFGCGTGALTVGGVTWTARPMGVAVGLAGSAPAAVPSEVASFLARHL